MSKLSRSTCYFLTQALREDIGPGDVTSRLLIAPDVRTEARITAKSSGIFCGKEILPVLLKGLRCRLLVSDGKKIHKGQTLIKVRGNARRILAVERTLLNILARLCGVATLTNQFVCKAKPFGVQILDTRKTTPLWRELEKYAVRTGGGVNHRMGLYDEVFVKENHRDFGHLEKLKKFPRRFVIEVRNKKELSEAIRLKPRVILFDNFSPAHLRKAAALAKRVDSQIILEASGGIHLSNVKAYAQTGVDQISLGCLTHSAPALDLSLLIKH